MSWLTIFRLIVIWYATVQLVTLAVLPLTLYALRLLPDRGYSLAKISGILLVGVIYWLGYSYGLLRNERGGAWIALLVVAASCWMAFWPHVVAWWRNLWQGNRLRSLVTTEVIFAVAFVAWAIVRAYDPNVDHTEEPMDLMFLNSIWSSPTYPPQDAWLAGYAISYYYLGYWLLATLARLANTPPSIAYNVGQAVWYGLLWSGSFAIVMNLLALRWGRVQEVEQGTPLRSIPSFSLWGGMLGGAAVAFVGNLQVILEWLYARGANIDWLIAWVDVNNFPENASRTGAWFIDFGWWWWRSSRVIADYDLNGNYRDVIDEFPMFSYLLGDNHPHVMGMPVSILIIGLALNLLLSLHWEGLLEDERTGWRRWIPFPSVDGALYVLALGSLVFLNTWDFPAYWLLLVAVVLLAGGNAWRRAIVAGAVLLGGTVLLYFPYFLTAQSQAAGILPNAFNPTRFPQFLILFGSMLPAVIGVIVLGWRLAKPTWPTVGWVAALVIGLPVAFLALTALLSSTEAGRERLSHMALPEGVTSYAEVIVERWTSEPWTLFFLGVLLAVVLACVVTLLQKPSAIWSVSPDLTFVLMLAGIGLALIYAPEFVYLRDHFGSRMNTVFKFYYQGWLLLGLSSAYGITVALRQLRRQAGVVQILSVLSLLLMVGCALFPIAGVYARTNGFSREMPTLDATAYVAQTQPDVMAAIEWIQQNTTPGDLVLEANGNSYWAQHNRVSMMTGRPTLLGWGGHESQWRGADYGRMAQGRLQAIEQIYRTAQPKDLDALLAQWDIDYVFVGPAEIELYRISQYRLEEFRAAMDPVFNRGQVWIFRRRDG